MGPHNIVKAASCCNYFVYVEALLKYETLDADDIKSIVEHKKPPPSKLSPPSTIPGLRPGLGQPLAPVSGLSGLGVAPPPIESLGSRTESGPVSS